MELKTGRAKQEWGRVWGIAVDHNNTRKGPVTKTTNLVKGGFKF